MRDFIVKTIVGKIGGGGHGTVTYYGAQLAADDILSELTRRAALKNKEQSAHTAALVECDACGWRGKQDALKPPHSLSDELPACPECASDEIGEVSALPCGADNSAMQVSPKPCPTCRGIGVLMDINLGRQKPCGACGGTGTASA